MSYRPLRLRCRALDKPAVTISTVRRYGRTYVRFHFASPMLKRLGWGRTDCVAPFVDPDQPRTLMLATAPSSDTSARALNAHGGISRYVSFPRIDELTALVPDEVTLRPVPVLSAAAGQLILDLSPLWAPPSKTP